MVDRGEPACEQARFLATISNKSAPLMGSHSAPGLRQSETETIGCVSSSNSSRQHTRTSAPARGPWARTAGVGRALLLEQAAHAKDGIDQRVGARAQRLVVLQRVRAAPHHPPVQVPHEHHALRVQTLSFTRILCY